VLTADLVVVVGEGLGAIRKLDGTVSENTVNVTDEILHQRAFPSSTTDCHPRDAYPHVSFQWSFRPGLTFFRLILRSSIIVQISAAESGSSCEMVRPERYVVQKLAMSRTPDVLPPSYPSFSELVSSVMVS
jgi:hypothetical protein